MVDSDFDDYEGAEEEDDGASLDSLAAEPMEVGGQGQGQGQEGGEGEEPPPLVGFQLAAVPYNQQQQEAQQEAQQQAQQVQEEGEGEEGK